MNVTYPMFAKTITDYGEDGSQATFDPDYRYRYLLERTWDKDLPSVNFIMLNPSTADAFILDPTVTRCIGYAKKWGCGTLRVTNLFALRSTDPKGLKVEGINPFEHSLWMNDQFVLLAAQQSDLVLCAWGNHGSLQGADEAVVAALQSHEIDLYCLKITKADQPVHPLYQKADLDPIEF